MFSFIRDRFIELEFPYQIPDCQIWPESQNNDESYKNSDKRRTRRSNEPEIVHVPREPSSNSTSESPKIIEFVEKYTYPVNKFLQDSPIQPEKSEYKRLKEIDQRKHVIPFSSDVAKLSENRKFNRYINILPYDFNRIKLKTPIDGIDYINGNYITGQLSMGDSGKDIIEEKPVKAFEFSKFRYINFLATQGPLQITLPHHWQAIYENDVDIIVMLTKLKEGGDADHPGMGTVKCSQYWPRTKEYPISVGNFRIDLEEETDFTSDIKKRILSIRNIDDTVNKSEAKKITQLHFVGWPDYGVPEGDDILSLSNLVKKVRYIIQSNQTKISEGKRFNILVHCSAGVGRTGTFIIMYKIMDQIEEMFADNSVETQNIDIFNEVLSLRSKRVEMVQSWAQYQFLYKSISEYAKYIKSLNDTSGDYVDLDEDPTPYLDNKLS